jgi:hypothetical protein
MDLPEHLISEIYEYDGRYKENKIAGSNAANII